MAYLLPDAVFFHLPKTGGQWVASALHRAGVVEGAVGTIHASPDEVADEPAVLRRSIRFVFVRHPLAWYRSMWAHRRDENWEPIDDPDWFSPRWIVEWGAFTDAARAPTFDGFVRNCVEAYPSGFLASLYRAYTDGCTHVGHYESLQDDLVRTLRESGLEVDFSTIAATPERNVRGSTPARQCEARYTPRLERLLLDAESEVLERYSYGRVRT